jgi:hypothetical protein
MTSKYIINGLVFFTQQEAENYATLKGLRITKIQTIQTKKGKRHILTLSK